MLSVTNLTKAFREPDGTPLPVLDVPAFQLGAGEQMVLMGSSGGGKTTLLHILAGISRPDSGEVVIGGLDITRLSEAGRDRFRADHIGYVFQTFNLLAGFSALENVLLGMTFRRAGVHRPRAKELLQRVGLGHRMHHRPGQLSVGEQQRVAVARALANGPQLLLADEPTANVDPTNQQCIVDLIRDTCRSESVALLVVTHAPEVARQFSRVDRLDTINRVMQQRRQQDDRSIPNSSSPDSSFDGRAQ
jgi:ABC-type lipoprotein export system ATPase subunit